ncbi:dTDP-4-dehydrorhamnose 3,5-epimerase [Clostridia bacterium]|nr:dTDP-4-dehydrorhamnose 3,5-epimerase [Clostridia bacterium]
MFVKDYNIDAFFCHEIDYNIKEVFYSTSGPGTIRGLHYQTIKPQAKLVRCIKGKIYDVIVDIRPTSKSAGKWIGLILSEKNYKAVLIPPGFAHGFLAIEESIVSYKCDETFMPEGDSGVFYADETLAIDWSKYHSGSFIVSERDIRLPSYDTVINNVRLI